MRRRLLKALDRLNPSCREAVHLMSGAIDQELPRLDRLGLQMHLILCRACRAYRRSILILRSLMRTAGENPPPVDGEGLNDAAKERILQKLRSP